MIKGSSSSSDPPTTTTSLSPVDQEQDELRARLEAFRKAKDAKQRAVQNAQKSVKYPAPFLVPKPEPAPPKPLSTHGFYDPEKQKKPSAVRPWRSTTTVTTGTVKNPQLSTKRSPPTAPTLKARETKPPIKRRTEPSREGTTCTVKKGVTEQTKRNGIHNAGIRPRERTVCTGAVASASTQTIPVVVAQGERERKVSDVRRDFRSAKSWKLRVFNPKTGFTVSEEHVPATYLYMFTLKDALNAAKRNEPDVARAIFEILYTEERRFTLESRRPMPVQRASYWTAWAKFEEEQGNYGKALTLLEEAIRRQKEPDELLVNTLIDYIHRYEISEKRVPLQQILSIGNATASQIHTYREPLQQINPIGSTTASQMHTYREPLQQINPITSPTASLSSTLHSRSATPSPEPHPFEVLEDPDSPMPSVPDFQSSMALELASRSPTIATKNEPERSPCVKIEKSTRLRRGQGDGFVDSDESFMEPPVLGTPQSRLGSASASFESESSKTFSPVSRNEQDELKTTDITNILDGLDINDRRDDTAAGWKKSNVGRSSKPKTIRFATDSEDSSVTVLTPIRPNKKEKDLFGVSSVITPVRRSARHLSKDTIVLEEDNRVAQLLEENGYSYVPNKSLKPTSRVCGTPRFQSKTSSKENVSNFDDLDATPNARKIAMQRRMGTGSKKSQEGMSDSEQPCTVAEETGLLYKYGEVTPSKRVKSLLGCDVTLSAVRRSARNLNRNGNGGWTDGTKGSGTQRFANNTLVVDCLEDLPMDIEYGYLPNPNIPKKAK